MVRILDFNEEHCWRRRKFSIHGKDFMLIASHKKSDSLHLAKEEAVQTQGFLIGDQNIYLIPPKKGIFQIEDIAFLVADSGVYCVFD